jgi:hypothetical protein
VSSPRSKLKCDRYGIRLGFWPPRLWMCLQGFPVPVMHKERMRRDLPGWYVRPFWTVRLAANFTAYATPGALSATKGNKCVAYVDICTDETHVCGSQGARGTNREATRPSQGHVFPNQRARISPRRRPISRRKTIAPPPSRERKMGGARRSQFTSGIGYRERDRRPVR